MHMNCVVKLLNFSQDALGTLKKMSFRDALGSLPVPLVQTIRAEDGRSARAIVGERMWRPDDNVSLVMLVTARGFFFFILNTLKRFLVCVSRVET